MPKKLIALFTILIVLLSVLIYVRFFYYIPSNTLISSDKKATAIVYKQLSLSLWPNPITATASESATVNVVIDAKQKADLVQLELSYDPSSLYNVNVFPGNYFSNPEVVLEKNDYKNGRISYALKSADVNADSNIVAMITFNAVTFGIQNESEILFLPKTLVKRDGKSIKIGATLGTVVVFKPLFYPLPFSSSPSAILQ